jgi:nucleosome assembly protein 1-like 1
VNVQPQVPDENEDIDEETMEELQALIETDYEVGDSFPLK